MKFQITNSTVVKLFWMNSMLVLMNCCKKENVGFLKEILSKFGKTPVFVLVIDYVIIIQMNLFQLVKNHKRYGYKFIEGTKSKM